MGLILDADIGSFILSFLSFYPHQGESLKVELNIGRFVFPIFNHTLYSEMP